MTLYFRNPGWMTENHRRMMRRMMENSYTDERVFSFRMQLSSTENEYLLKARLPGVSAEDVNLQYNDGVLTIEGEYRDLAGNNSEKLFSEFPVGKFSRSIEIKEPVLSDNIEASMKDGILTIRIPKAEVTKPKTIKINIS